MPRMIDYDINLSEITLFQEKTLSDFWNEFEPQDAIFHFVLKGTFSLKLLTSVSLSKSYSGFWGNPVSNVNRKFT